MDNIIQLVKKDMLALEENILAYLKTPNDPTNQVIAHIFRSGGKRLRPLLFFLCSELIGYEGEHRIPIAAVCEYIHTASLLHDDVIDNSTLRRNKPTANSIWGDETAVLAGDLIYAAACRLMVKTKSLELIDTFAECIRFMSESELFGLDLLWKKSTNFAEYERLILGKTATLFAASCKTPAYLGVSDARVVKCLDEYGKNLGLAFQIMDDCLDYTASEKDFGKPACQDVFEGKVTLPLIYALEEGHKELNRFIEHVFIENYTQKDMVSYKLKLAELMAQTTGVSRALQKAKECVDQAVQCMEEMTKIIPNYNRECHNALVQLAQYSLVRKS